MGLVPLFSIPRISWVDIAGIKYYKEGVVVLQSNLLPVFGVIIDIIVHQAQYHFVCNVLHTECYNSHFHAYEVSKGSTEYTICTHSELVDHHVLSRYNLPTSPSQFIPLKYHIIEHIV